MPHFLPLLPFSAFFSFLPTGLPVSHPRRAARLGGSGSAPREEAQATGQARGAEAAKAGAPTPGQGRARAGRVAGRRTRGGRARLAREPLARPGGRGRSVLAPAASSPHLWVGSAASGDCSKMADSLLRGEAETVQFAPLWLGWRWWRASSSSHCSRREQCCEPGSWD